MDVVAGREPRARAAGRREVDGLRASQLEQPRLREPAIEARCVDAGLRQGVGCRHDAAVRAVRAAIGPEAVELREGVEQREPRTEERGRLVSRPERRDFLLETGCELESEAGRDDEIAGPVEVFRREQARVEIGREEHGPREGGAQRAEHGDLVVEVAAEHADRTDLALAECAQPVVLRLDLAREPAQVVELPDAFGGVGAAFAEQPVGE